MSIRLYTRDKSIIHSQILNTEKYFVISRQYCVEFLFFISHCVVMSAKFAFAFVLHANRYIKSLNVHCVYAYT